MLNPDELTRLVAVAVDENFGDTGDDMTELLSVVASFGLIRNPLLGVAESDIPDDCGPLLETVDSLLSDYGLREVLHAVAHYMRPVS